MKHVTPAIVLLACLLAVESATAAPITLNFIGTVTQRCTGTTALTTCVDNPVGPAVPFSVTFDDGRTGDSGETPDYTWAYFGAPTISGIGPEFTEPAPGGAITSQYAETYVDREEFAADARESGDISSADTLVLFDGDNQTRFDYTFNLVGNLTNDLQGQPVPARTAADLVNLLASLSATGGLNLQITNYLQQIEAGTITGYDPRSYTMKMSLRLVPDSVPEPATLLLLGSGVVAAIVRRRKARA